MPSTLAAQSFTKANLGERTSLKLAAAAGDQALRVESVSGFEVGSIIYVGALAREQCEKATILAIPDATTINLTVALKYDHGTFDPVQAVIGDLIRIWRAPNVDGQVPALEAFSVYATRNINPEANLTYYTDASGSADFWYRATYFNATTQDGTDLEDSVPVRGDDFGHYASLEAIRREAGFQSAHRLSDVDVDAQRRAAEAEINSTLGNFMTTPFKKPIPDIINVVTIKLAAGLLVANAYRRDANKEQRVVEARAMLTALQTGHSTTGDESNPVASGVSGSFGDEDDGDRLFNIGDEY